MAKVEKEVLREHEECDLPEYLSLRRKSLCTVNIFIIPDDVFPQSQQEADHTDVQE